MNRRAHKQLVAPFQDMHEKNALFSHRWLLRLVFLSFTFLLFLSISACVEHTATASRSESASYVSAEEILGNNNYRGVCYGGYRDTSRAIQPTLEEIKEDLKILSAIGIRIVRTYDVKFEFSHNVARAIKELKAEDPSFEMYIMLGAWIQCIGANTDHPDHSVEDTVENAAEIARAVNIANNYPDLVKIIAVGNEAMVHWQTKYSVEPGVILKWVEYLQDLKAKGVLLADLWITSSDNFASWGGEDEKYHKEDLNSLIRAVDFVSMHTYPMHDTHYNPEFWGIRREESTLSDSMIINLSMQRAFNYAVKQFKNTSAYVAKIDSTKPVHIGETGWATSSGTLYGSSGSRATDEYKSGIYYKMINDWADKNQISCFYFEAFDEIWKDRTNPMGSENHFGLFDVNGKAKYSVWGHVENGSLEGLHRGGIHISKTFDGDKDALMKSVELPPINSNLK